MLTVSGRLARNLLVRVAPLAVVLPAAAILAACAQNPPPPPPAPAYVAPAPAPAPAPVMVPRARG